MRARNILRERAKIARVRDSRASQIILGFKTDYIKIVCSLQSEMLILIELYYNYDEESVLKKIEEVS